MTYLTVAEFAILHNVSRAAVYLWRDAGLLPGAYQERRNGHYVTRIPADLPKPKLKRGAKFPPRTAARFVTEEAEALARELFDRHRCAAAKLGVTSEVASSWEEFVPDALDILRQRRAWREDHFEITDGRSKEELIARREYRQYQEGATR